MKEFASFDRVFLREKNNLQELHDSLYRTRIEMAEKTAGAGLSSQEGQLYLTFFAAQSSRIRYQEELVQKVRIELERKRREMGNAISRRKIFENLKEKHIEEEKRREKRFEARELDEISGVRFTARARRVGASA